MKFFFKNLLNEQFKTAKNYKPKLEWYEGVWSRFKPEKGKDKRGITGVSKEKIKKIGEKITNIPKNFSIHPTIKIIFLAKWKYQSLTVEIEVQGIILTLGLFLYFSQTTPFPGPTSHTLFFMNFFIKKNW